MKIRSDFVTNSSSSSFILGFTSEEKMAQELLEDYTGNYVKLIYEDCKNSEGLSLEDSISYLREYLVDDISYIAEQYFEEMYYMSWHDKYEFKKSKAFQKTCFDLLEKYLEEFKEAVQNKPVLKKVEYSDDCCSELEHEIVPNLKCCLARISHH